jgi:putative oxidoreductase
MYSLAMFIIRIVTGVIFIAHGIPKIFGGKGSSEKLSDQQKQMLGEGFVNFMEGGGIDNTVNMMESLAIPQPKLMAWVAAIAELGGGIAVLLGIKTRPAALGLAATQVVAIGKMTGKKGLVGGYELNLMLLGAAAAIAVAGPGKLAKD